LDHVRRWWGNPIEEIGIIERSLDHPGVAMWIVSYQGRDFAFIQDYDIRTWPQVHFAYLPAGSRAIDLFIGDPLLTDAGHGSAFLRGFAGKLIGEGIPLIAIDPDYRNLRARRAYEKAGFHGKNETQVGKEKVVLMTFTDASPEA